MDLLRQIDAAAKNLHESADGEGNLALEHVAESDRRGAELQARLAGESCYGRPTAAPSGSSPSCGRPPRAR